MDSLFKNVGLLHSSHFVQAVEKNGGAIIE